MLLQLYGPVGIVQELFPAPVSLMAEVNVDEGIMPGFGRFLNEGHTGLFWGSAAFPDVAFRAGTDDVFPGGFAARASWDNVVEGQLGGRLFPAAVLATALVAGKDIAPVEFDFVAGQAVVKQQTNYSRHGDIIIDG